MSQVRIYSPIIPAWASMKRDTNPNLSNITAMLTKITKFCTQLRKLDVSYCPDLTDEAIRVVAMNCPDLRRLNAANCPQLTNAALESLALHCSKLRQLNAFLWTDINDQGVIALSKTCTHLNRLSEYITLQLEGIILD